MFKGCTSLTTAPELPATTLVQGCYGYMFEDCCNLSYIKMLATDISASWCLSNWVSGVSDTGNFVKSSSATWDETGVSGIPSGWTVFTPNSGILLNKAAISLNVGATEKLTASVAPFVANPEIIWTSSDENVATVSSTGMVTAIAVGASTITAKSGGFTATCAISVKIIPAGAVDLGLSVFWASSNLSESGFVGSPEEYGDYYAWGETSTYYSSQDPLTWKNGKTGYDWESYSLYDSNNYSLTKYNNNSNYGIVDNKTVLDPEDDVAHVKLGGSWRMPTDAEWTELRENCTWTWTTQNGVKGRLVTSNTNGNSIFLPAAGSRSNASLFNAGSLGLYRSSSLVTNSLYYAWSVSLDYATVERGNTLRCNGLSVRPVAE